MRKARGLFIVIEGLDGSGTTTQTRLLHDHITRRGTRSCITCEPTDEPIGKLIRDALTGRLSSPGSGKKTMFSERARCLLFAADRQEHSIWVEKHRSKGSHVICDRYILSSIAYQTLDHTISPEWVIEVNRGCAVPNLTILLDVPVEECLKRLRSRRDSRTIYEKRAHLSAIMKNYTRTIPIYKKHFGPLVRINGARLQDEVHEAVLKAVDSRIRL